MKNAPAVPATTAEALLPKSTLSQILSRHMDGLALVLCARLERTRNDTAAQTVSPHSTSTDRDRHSVRCTYIMCRCV